MKGHCRYDLHGGHAVHFRHGVVGLGDGNDDLRDVEGHLGTVALDDLHFYILLCPPGIYILCVYLSYTIYCGFARA